MTNPLLLKIPISCSACIAAIAAPSINFHKKMREHEEEREREKERDEWRKTALTISKLRAIEDD